MTRKQIATRTASLEALAREAAEEMWVNAPSNERSDKDTWTEALTPIILTALRRASEAERASLNKATEIERNEIASCRDDLLAQGILLKHSDQENKQLRAKLKIAERTIANTGAWILYKTKLVDMEKLSPAAPEKQPSVGAVDREKSDEH